ncbi:hypothetical protein [Alkalispirochaeta americana]|uniref:hypothetical protein n=1 Tax=Alkalispirochaeta americana TaxID=159291 RepID=UPI001F20C0FF|nr:hypothetical protein [Alkalispirochaeta americana]
MIDALFEVSPPLAVAAAVLQGEIPRKVAPQDQTVAVVIRRIGLVRISLEERHGS